MVRFTQEYLLTHLTVTIRQIKLKKKNNQDFEGVLLSQSVFVKFHRFPKIYSEFRTESKISNSTYQNTL